MSKSTLAECCRYGLSKVLAADAIERKIDAECQVVKKLHVQLRSYKVVRDNDESQLNINILLYYLM